MAQISKRTFQLFVALLLFTVDQLAADKNEQYLMVHNDCKQVSQTSQCNCTEFYSDFKVICEGGGFEIQIKTNFPYSGFYLYCYRANHKDSSYLPQMNIGPIFDMSIEPCSFKPSEVLQRFGIPQVDHLYYRSTPANNVTSPPADFFPHLDTLTTLTFQSHNVKLHRDNFAALENIEYIHLEDNNIQHLPPGIFRNLKHLVTLYLRNNSLTDLTKEAFDGASSIAHLDLGANNIVTLRSDVFAHLTNLRAIKLDENYIKFLPVDLFAANKNIVFLDISRNQLTTLPDDIFQNTTQLRRLLLSKNHLQNVSRSIHWFLTNVETGPELEFNDEFSRGLYAYDQYVVDLSNNSIRTIGFDANYTVPKRDIRAKINIENNPLNCDCNFLAFLQFLNEKGPKLYKDSIELMKCSTPNKLRDRKLSDIQREELNCPQNDTPRTQCPIGCKCNAKERHAFIDCSNRNLTEFPIIPVSALNTSWDSIELNIENNKITELPQAIVPGYHAVRTLHAANNSLTTISSENLPKFTTLLNVSHNNIQTLDNNFYNFFAISTMGRIIVDLSDNSIRTIDMNVTADGNRISRAFFKILHNPFHCDCNLLFFVQFLRAEVGLPKDFFVFFPENILCTTPKRLQGRMITNILPQELLCPLDDEPSSQKQCPIGCTCWVRSFDSTLIVNCSNGELTEVPSLPVMTTTYWNRIELHVENNKLKQLPTSKLPGYSTVHRLYAANNSLTAISVDNLPKHVNFLDASHNNIQALDITFLKSFENYSIYGNDSIVDLSHNAIRTIDVEITDTLGIVGNRVLFNIDYNPLQCDCKLLSFVEFLSKIVEPQHVLRIPTNNLMCNTPERLKDRLITDLFPGELLCSLDAETSSQKQCPIECTCWVRSFDNTLIVNCSNGELVAVPSLPVMTTIWNRTELYIENNKIKKLPLATTDKGYWSVNQIYAANNRITTISVDNLPKDLKLLNVSHNKIQALDTNFLKALSERRFTVTLSHNPWSCDCSTQNLFEFLLANQTLIPDNKQMQCVSGKRFHEVSIGTICPVERGLGIGISTLISLGLCMGILTALYYKYQQQVKVWLYANNMCLWFVKEEELDKNKKYDAFISYSHKDEAFITNHLIPELESGPTPFKLCIHVRDWVVGDLIPNQILRSVDESRRTIIVLSSNFIESIWAPMEFRTAHVAALNEGRARVIVIIYGDIGSIDKLDPELKAYLQMNTYVKWGDPWFWKKLRYAMPHSGRVNAKAEEPTMVLALPPLINTPIVTFPSEEITEHIPMHHSIPVTSEYINNSL